ncbi:MAG: CDP-glucose 4,6-dehydratase [Planctomycetes bacterium]|nr:CDP-glucose 4,6-dehydratase [Planctomycetota bacterium]
MENKPFLDTFRGLSVFVTGHTGFKGSWLCLWLSRLGARITGYALEPPTDPNNFTVSRVREVLASHHEADIRDTARLTSALKQANPDLVLHLAAQSVVRRGYEIPYETFDVNVMGTASVLEAVRKLNKPCAIVAVTSDKCYENREQVWGYREEDALGEHDPYGGSKGAAELVIRSYRHSFFPPDRQAEHGVRLASARAGNVIGGGDWTPHALIVDIVRALALHQPVAVRSPNAYRPWQHVLQALSGYLTLAARLLDSDNPQLSSGWNIGPLPGNELPVRELVGLFLRDWGRGEFVDASAPNQPHEATILRLAVDKAIWLLGWKPCWDTRETIRRTVQWYRDYHSGDCDMRAVCDAQIQAYQSDMWPIPK